MPQMCCVPTCKTIWFKNCGISFHDFPKGAEMRQRWLNALGIKNWKANSRVCSKHFQEVNYVFGANHKKLSKFAIPQTISSHSQSSNAISHVHLPRTEMEVNSVGASSDLPKTSDKVVMMWEKNKENISPLQIEKTTESATPLKISKKRKAKSGKTSVKFIKSPTKLEWNLDKVVNENPTEANTTNPKRGDTISMENISEENDERIPCSQCVSYLRTIEILEKEVSYLKKENERLQQSSKPQSVFNLAKFAVDDRKILFYTGFQTYSILLIVFQWVLPSGNTYDINYYNSRTTSRNRITKVSAENQFFLTLLRLKRGMSIETLSDLFSISKATVNNIFITWINLMYLRLGSLNIWPNRNVLIERAPANMLEKYPNIIGSIDCTEFFIQSPSSFVKQTQCYSNYKSTTTLKSLLMIEPGGAIIYISPLFTGSISDKSILEKSGFMAILKEKMDEGSILPGDIILADKGFNVKNLFESINLNLNIPVFRIGGTQFTSAEVETTRKIAQERIHVERAIGRLKTYRILSLTKIPISCLGSMNQIYTVCALLCNFKYALIK